MGTHKKAAFCEETVTPLLRSLSVARPRRAREDVRTFSGDSFMAGYAGYAPGHAVQELTEKQKALRAVESVAALEMLEKLFGNVAKNPSEKKYRRVKFETNTKIKAAFESGKCTSEIALRCFLTHGWVVEEEEENNERVVKLPDSVQQTFRDVLEVTERKEALQKELQAAFRRRVAARSKAAASGEKETLLKQLEADKLERAAKGPVTEGSKRVDGALGNGGFSTPQDIGCSGSA